MLQYCKLVCLSIYAHSTIVLQLQVSYGAPGLAQKYETRVEVVGKGTLSDAN